MLLDLAVAGLGEYPPAETLMAQCREAGATRLLPYALHVLAQAHMYRGRHGQASGIATEGLRLASKSGQFHHASRLKGLLAWLAAVEGEEALARFEGLWSGGPFHGAARLAPDHIEAAVRCGRPDQASRPLALLEAWAGRSGDPLVAAVALRCQALTGRGKQAARCYETAMRLHEGIDQPYEQARTLLAFGEWLRRARRRSAARTG
ncbi:hypothetical protein GCM10010191_78640 [Actinomadura vinacea]|uniref:Tetratricopeptide repeat protein n=1 Tax=Actinomadura vinacea TaxID=115336 RepID=A0ABN3K4K9_9ACTN